MNKEQVFGSWKEVSGKLKQQYAELTDDDLAYREGKEEEVLGKIQKKTGKTRKELESQLESYTKR